MSGIKRNKTVQPPAQIQPDSLYRLSQFIPHHLPISKSAWWQGVKSGRYPKPIKLGPRTTAWRGRDLLPILNGENR